MHVCWHWCFLQKQDCYKVIQALVQHLDEKAKDSCSIKQGILDALSQCVIAAADESLGKALIVDTLFQTFSK